MYERRVRSDKPLELKWKEMYFAVKINELREKEASFRRLMRRQTLLPEDQLSHAVCSCEAFCPLRVSRSVSGYGSMMIRDTVVFDTLENTQNSNCSFDIINERATIAQSTDGEGRIGNAIRARVSLAARKR